MIKQGGELVMSDLCHLFNEYMEQGKILKSCLSRFRKLLTNLFAIASIQVINENSYE